MNRPNLESISEYVRRVLQAREPASAPDSVSQSQRAVAAEPSTMLEASHRAAPLIPAPAIDDLWRRVAEIRARGEVTTGIVTGWNRGGLLVRWNGLQGFVPASQLKDVPVFVDDASRDEKLSRWVGRELPLKVIELDESRNRLVFSERATVWGPLDGERLLNELSPGDIREGHVSNICDFGAFVDLGGIDGLIHISELSWKRVIHPSRHLQMGQRVRVCILSVDRDGRHIALSLKRLLPNPWSTVDERYHVNQVVNAVITNIVEFGAFAQLEEGLEGLIHVSQMLDGETGDVHRHPTIGDRVAVRILRIDAPRHRLSLSMHLTPAEDGAAPGLTTPPPVDRSADA